MGFANKLDLDIDIQGLSDSTNDFTPVNDGAQLQNDALGLGVRLSQCRHLRVKLGGKLKPGINLPKGERPFWHS
jgi:hypothetical protein